MTLRESRWNSVLSAYFAYAQITCGLHPSSDDLRPRATDRNGEEKMPGRAIDPLLEPNGNASSVGAVLWSTDADT